MRNKITAHVDADVDIWAADLKNWPMTIDHLIDEAIRVIEAVRRCAELDICSKMFFIPPQYIRGIVGLAGQEGRRWRDG